jgi:hypothetical protein
MLSFCRLSPTIMTKFGEGPSIWPRPVLVEGCDLRVASQLQANESLSIAFMISVANVSHCI